MKTLFFEPASTVEMINHGYSDQALDAVREYFGDFPITVRPEDLKVLRAISIGCQGRPLRDIIMAVELHGAIRIWWDDPNRASRDQRLRDGDIVLDATGETGAKS